MTIVIEIENVTIIIEKSDVLDGRASFRKGVKQPWS